MQEPVVRRDALSQWTHAIAAGNVNEHSMVAIVLLRVGVGVGRLCSQPSCNSDKALRFDWVYSVVIFC
jgi:hypothetical protein